MTAPLEISAPTDGSATIVVAGEVDMSNVDRLRAALDGAGGPGPLVVDLAAVEYMDSAGIAALFACAERVPLHIRCRPGSAVSSLIAVTRLEEMATVEEA